MSRFKLTKYPLLSQIMRLCPDKWFIRLRWNANMPYRLNLKHSQSIYEKCNGLNFMTTTSYIRPWWINTK